MSGAKEKNSENGPECEFTEVLASVGTRALVDVGAVLLVALEEDAGEASSPLHLVFHVEQMLRQWSMRKTDLLCVHFPQAASLFQGDAFRVLCYRTLLFHLRSQEAAIPFVEAPVEWPVVEEGRFFGRWVLSSSLALPYLQWANGVHLRTREVVYCDTLEYRGKDVWAFVQGSVRTNLPLDAEFAFDALPEARKVEDPVAEAVKTMPESPWNAVALEMSSAIRTLPLRYRAFELPAEPVPGSQEFFSSLCAALAPFEVNSIDLVDGRLLQAIALKRLPKVAAGAGSLVAVEHVEASKMFPFSQRFVTEVMGEDKLQMPTYAMDSPEVLAVSTDTQRFFDDHHWHTGKPLELGEVPVVKKVQERWQRRAEQKAKDWSAKLAESLAGKYVKKESIVASKKKVKNKQSKKSLAIAEAGRKEKAIKDIADQKKEWSVKKKEYLTPDLEYDTLYDKYLHMGRDEVSRTVLRDTFEYLLTRQPQMRVLMLRVAFDLLEMGEDVLEQTRLSRVDLVAFQLKHMGEFLRRAKGTRDDRIRHFEPDRWQVRLLDAVDADKSVLVVAPTSSGKTFISMYVCEKVLRESDDGMVIYVAPTKALVNQVQSEISARFEKTYTGHAEGTALVGVFTRDWRYRADSCQVLVTVPQCLEMLLLAPSKRGQQWVNRLRYVVFDEVHNLNEAHSGHVWERLLQMVKCPIIALSATLGDGDAFASWLRRDARPVELIEWPHRYNDLRFHYMDTELEQQSLSPLAMLSAREIKANGFPPSVTLEPRDAADLYQELRRVLGEAVADLAPATFFETHFADTFKGAISRPMFREWETALKERVAGMELKALEDVLSTHALDETRLLGALEAADSDEATSRACRALVTQLQSSGDLPAIFFCFSRSHAESMALEVLEKLESQEAVFLAENAEAHERLQKELVDAEKAATELKEEFGKRNVNPLYNPAASQEMDAANEKINSIKAKLTAHVRDERFSLRSVGQGRGDEFRQKIIGRMFRRKAKFSASGWERNHPMIKALERGIGVHHAGLPTKYRNAVEILFRTQDVVVAFATSTLAQGIHMPCRTVAFAHDSVFLNSVNFRQMAGRSGRRGYDLLGRVVFCNVPPHKIRRLMHSQLPEMRGSFPLSVSLVLKLVQLHQAMEQGARPQVREQFRSLCKVSLLGHASSSDAFGEQLAHYARFAVELLMRQGVLAPGLDAGTVATDVLEEVRKVEEEDGDAAPQEEEEEEEEDDDSGLAWDDDSLEIDINLDDDEELAVDPTKEEAQEPAEPAAPQYPAGTPVGLAGLVTHLAWTEPCNLLLLEGFRTGAFRDICTDPNTSDDDKVLKLLQLLAVLVAPYPLFRGGEKGGGQGASKLLLEVPEEAKTLIKSYNRTTLDVFQDYVVSYCAKHPEPPTMPLSGAVSNDVVTPEAEALKEELGLRVIPSSSRSPFAALLGKGDHYTSLEEMIESVRSIYMDHNSVPVFPAYGNLNAYITDFFESGSIASVQKYNRVKDVWALLKNFSLVLQTIKTTLTLLSERDGPQVIEYNTYTLQQQIARDAKEKSYLKKDGKTDADEYADIKDPVTRIFSMLSDQFGERFQNTIKK